MSTIDQTTPLLNWNILALLSERNDNLQQLQKNKLLQEENFKKNYKIVAKQIADTIAENIPFQFGLTITDPRQILPISKDSSVTFYCSFMVQEAIDPQEVGSGWFGFCARETADLLPYSEWRTGIHYYTYEELKNNIFQNKFAEIRDAAISYLRITMKTVQTNPVCYNLEFSVDPIDTIKEAKITECALIVKLWLDLKKKPPQDPKEIEKKTTNLFDDVWDRIVKKK